MSEPTITQTLRAMVERKGAVAVGITLLRAYWKPVIGTLGVAISFGIVIQQGRDAKDELAAIKVAQVAQAAQNAAVNDRLTRLEADWGALFGAAHITVTPNAPTAGTPGKKAKPR